MEQWIDISKLPEPIAQAILEMLKTYNVSPQDQGERKAGWAKGKIPELPKEFFDPLPDDILDMFEGKNSDGEQF